MEVVEDMGLVLVLGTWLLATKFRAEAFAAFSAIYLTQASGNSFFMRCMRGAVYQVEINSTTKGDNRRYQKCKAARCEAQWLLELAQ